MKEEERIIYNEAINTYGVDNQIRMYYEESAELTDALCKFKRRRLFPKQVITEIADVMIMCEQLALIFGEDEVEKEKKGKIQRLKNRIKEVKEEKINQVSHEFR